nr:unnamed protein product [Callosobruchus analis]
MFIQIFFYCWYGHNVTAKSQDLGRAVYMSNFYVSDLKIRKALIIFMERSKRPLILRCGFFTVSLATLTSVSIEFCSLEWGCAPKHSMKPLDSI